jgi:hypothetical protein
MNARDNDTHESMKKKYIFFYAKYLHLTENIFIFAAFMI